MNEAIKFARTLRCASGADLPHLPHPGTCLSERCVKCVLLRTLEKPPKVTPFAAAKAIVAGWDCEDWPEFVLHLSRAIADRDAGL